MIWILGRKENSIFFKVPCIASNDGEHAENTVLDFRETWRVQTRPERAQHTADIKGSIQKPPLRAGGWSRVGTKVGSPGTVMLSIRGCRQEATKDTWQETHEADGKKITWVQCLGNQREKMLQEGSFDEPRQVLLLDQVR